MAKFKKNNKDPILSALLDKIRKYNISKSKKINFLEEVENIPIESIKEVEVDLISATKLNIRARIGKKYIPLSSIKKLGAETNIVLNQLANDPLEILIQNQIIGLAEVIVIDGNFGVQITEIFEKSLEDKSYYHKDNQNKLDPMVLFEAILGDIDYNVEDILKLAKSSIIDFEIPVGSFPKLYVNNYHIGYGEIIVYERHLGIAFIYSKKAEESKIPILSDEDRERFKASNDTINKQQKYTDNFSKLNELSSDMLFTILSTEHPQAIAVVLLNLEECLAKDILSLFNIENSYEIILRMSRLKNISDESLLIVSQTLKKLSSEKVNKETFDGLTKATNILKLLEPENLKNHLDNISQLDEELSDVLKKGVSENTKE